MHFSRILFSRRKKFLFELSVSHRLTRSNLLLQAIVCALDPKNQESRETSHNVLDPVQSPTLTFDPNPPLHQTSANLPKNQPLANVPPRAEEKKEKKKKKKEDFEHDRVYHQLACRDIVSVSVVLLIYPILPSEILSMDIDIKSVLEAFVNGTCSLLECRL